MTTKPKPELLFIDLCEQHAAILGRDHRKANVLNTKITATFKGLLEAAGPDQLLLMATKSKSVPAAVWSGILLYEQAELNANQRKAIMSRMKRIERSEQSLVGSMVDAFMMEHEGE